MVENLNFLVAPLLLALFGLPAGFAPGVRRASAWTRFSLSFMTGTVVMVVWGTLLSTLGIEWRAGSVLVLPGLASLAGAVAAVRMEDRTSAEYRGAWNLVAYAVGGAAVANLALMALTSKATSIDFFYFWGVKASRFAEAGGIDAAYLSLPYAIHTHVPYPPLAPLVGAWGVELVGRLPWRAGLVSSVVWIALALPVVLRGLRSRLPVGEATIATGVWVVALSLALRNSYSAGNAEAPLLFFTTIAVTALIAREHAFPSWVAPVAAGGVVLTKTEGLVLWGLLVVGVGAREILERRTASEILTRHLGLLVIPPLALAPWVVFLLRNDLPLRDAARETLGEISMGNLVPAIVESLRYMEAGSGWLAWGLAALVLGLSWRHWRSVLPGLAITVGVPAFLLFYYLHFQGDALGAWVRWTLPRVSLTALSAALLAAAVAAGGSDSRGSAADPSASQ
jgi:hypothetical protein